jgi:hypothetical protein
MRQYGGLHLAADDDPANEDHRVVAGRHERGPGVGQPLDGDEHLVDAIALEVAAHHLRHVGIGVLDAEVGEHATCRRPVHVGLGVEHDHRSRTGVRDARHGHGGGCQAIVRVGDAHVDAHVVLVEHRGLHAVRTPDVGARFPPLRLGDVSSGISRCGAPPLHR